jgi:GTP-binding protein
VYKLFSYSVGIHQRPSDLVVNIIKTKALNNIRSATKEITTGCIPAVEMSLDACVEYLNADEILEVTPTLFRMAKNPDLMTKKGGNKN